MKKEGGASLVEYVILVLMVSLAAMMAIRDTGEKISAKFEVFGEAMGPNNVTEGPPPEDDPPTSEPDF